MTHKWRKLHTLNSSPKVQIPVIMYSCETKQVIEKFTSIAEAGRLLNKSTFSINLAIDTTGEHKGVFIESINQRVYFKKNYNE